MDGKEDGLCCVNIWLPSKLLGDKDFDLFLGVLTTPFFLCVCWCCCSSGNEKETSWNYEVRYWRSEKDERNKKAIRGRFPVRFIVRRWFPIFFSLFYFSLCLTFFLILFLVLFLLVFISVLFFCLIQVNQIIKVDEKTTSGRKFSFSIMVSTTGTANSAKKIERRHKRTYYLETASQKDKEEWMNCLRVAVEEERDTEEDEESDEDED